MTTTLSAAQLVYGNVGTSQSPQQRSGFQTLCRTISQLTDQVVNRELEPRLFFNLRDFSQSKLVFFRIGDGRVALAKIIPLEATDESGRGGLYLAHALVFETKDFRRLDNSPFPVFHKFPFFNTVEQALTAGTKLGDIGAARVDITLEDSITEYDKLPRERLLQLSEYTHQSLRSSNDATHICFYGKTLQILEILNDLFLILPVQLRLMFSFDTCFVGGTLKNTPYFAMGYPADELRLRQHACFDIEQSEFTPVGGIRSATSYDRWLKWMLHPPLTDISKQISDAFQLGAQFDGQQISKDQWPTKTDALLGFRSVLELRLIERINSQVGASVGKRIRPQVLRWAREQAPAALLTPTLRGFSNDQLAAWMVEAYEQFYEKPSSEELEQIGRLASNYDISFLRLLCLRWEQQWTLLGTTLSSVDKSQANRFKKWALASVSAYVHPVIQVEQGFTLVLSFRGGAPNVSEGVKLIASLLKIPPESLLSDRTSGSDQTQAGSDINFGLLERRTSIKELIYLVELLIDNSKEES